MKKGNLANKEMLKLMVFFLMLFAPITVNADEPTDTTDSDSGSEEANEAKNASNESETITDTTATFTGSYDTEEEANNRKDEKETEYQEAGYENIQSDITSVTTSDEEEITIDRTFDDKEDADSLLEVFLDTYEDATGEVTEVRTDEVIETTEGTTPYDTEEAAQTALDNYIADNDDAYYFEGEVVGPKATGEYTDREEINEHFDSKDAANEHIANLKNDGYIVENTEFTHDTDTQDVTLPTGTYATEAEAQAALDAFKNEHPNATWNEDATGITYVAAGTVDDKQPISERVTQSIVINRIGNAIYVIVKKGDTYYVWTEEALDEEAKAQFIETYAALGTKPPFASNNIAGAEFVSGYGTDFGDKGKKTFHFEEAEDGIIFVANHPSISQFVYGGFTADPTYYVNAAGTEEIELDSGTLTGKKKKAIEGYYFNTTKKKKQWHLTATATDTVETTTYYLTVKADIPQEKEAKREATTEENVVNPQTSDSVIKYATLLTLSVGISVLGCLALRSNRKKFN